MFDYHTHSSFSWDSSAPLEDMVQRALSLGLKGYAVTEHYDPDYRNPKYDCSMDFSGYHDGFAAVSNRHGASIKLAKGVEIGLQTGKTMEKCRAALAAFPYDFVLASIHCAEDMDISIPEYFEGRPAEEAYRGFYSYTLKCVEEFKDYDVIAHLNVIDRYAGAIPGDDAYMDIVRKIISRAVDDGKGIEINTSSSRYGMSRSIPTPEMLRLYVKLGGETITTGSDAHRPEDVGWGLERASEMIREAGLKYVATFKGRKAIYEKV
jgi:histidinol-phosphatase (PHP family)